MRWPLRSQLFLPTAIVLIASVVVVSFWNAWLALRRAENAIQTQVRRIADEFDRLSVPLNAGVLRVTSQLTGVQLVVQPAKGPATASNDAFANELSSLAPLAAAERVDQLAASHPVRIADDDWLHGSVQLRREAVGGDRATLHVFYPQKQRRSALVEAFWPPLAVGTIAVAVMMGVTVWMSRRFVRPIHDLQRQAAKISNGDYQPSPVPARDDELRDLAIDFNRMAERLAGYETEIRAKERLATLATLGSGVAHQIRNAATGAKMALDLHVADTGNPDESMTVARRQLELIETHVQRFLAVGRPHDVRADFDLGETIAAAVALVEPTARHWGVELRAVAQKTPTILHGDATGFQQAIVNLLTNAIEAAAAVDRSSPVDHSSSGNGDSKPQVEIAWSNSGNVWRVDVRDNGSGPNQEIVERLFTPFATNKRGGTGLGLFMAKQIAAEHQATLAWRREADWTVFTLAQASS